jgi:hypothetical protein
MNRTATFPEADLCRKARALATFMPERLCSQKLSSSALLEVLLISFLVLA